MTSVYSDFEDFAADMIDEFGTPVILRAPGEASGDPWAPTLGAPTDTAVNVVFEEYADALVNGGLVQVGDRKALLAGKGLSVVPTTEHQLVHAGKEFEIVNVKREAPAGGAIVYYLQVRG